MPRTKLPLDKLQNTTKLERERILKKTAGEDREKLEAMGQESNRKAAKWVKEEARRQEVEEKKIQDVVMEKLDDARGKVITYKSTLIEEMKREMSYWDDEVPTGFHWLVQSTDKGIVLWIQNPQRQYFAKGLKLSGIPKYDLNGIARMVIQAVQEMVKQSKPQDKIVVPYK